MLGGGKFLTQNKVLPGSYINFVSAARAAANLSDRGYAAMALPLKWGEDGKIFTVTANDFRKKTRELFGFTYDSEEAKGLRDLFKNASVLYCYKLMNGGNYAVNTVAKAKYKGSAGTRISTEILSSTEEGKFDVNIWFDTSLVVEESVSTLEELKKAGTEWVTWTLEELAPAAKAALTGEKLDGEEITAAEHSAFLDAAQAYSFNTMGCISDEDTIKSLYIEECKDMRDNAGVKYQVVVFNKSADYEGVINVKNCLEAVYWTTGAAGGCAVNASNTNKIYDGEFDIPASYEKNVLEAAINSGEFTFHKIGDDIRVLTDINSLVTTTTEKGEDFKSNQTIRVLDQIATDIAKVFNDKYLGKIPNDASGRISLWNDIVTHHQRLEGLRAIENFNSDEVIVTPGENKRSVVVSDVVSVVNAMEKLYMTVIVE